MTKHTGPVVSILVLGLLTACSSHRQLIRMESENLIAAKAELREVDKALRMYRAASPDSAFPEEEQITSYLDLWIVLLPHVKLPDEVNTHWTFISYQRPLPGTYMIQAKRGGRQPIQFMPLENGGYIVLTDSDMILGTSNRNPPPE
ncbi:hypothetical protein ACFL6R_00295 [Gemmatimonadota bacterium]